MTVPYCSCGHAQQIHGARRLTPEAPRGEGPCSACICDNYSEGKR